MINEHEWALGACTHEMPLPPLSDGKKWLTADSPAHVALRKVLMDRTWLQKAGEKYCNFR